MSSITVGTLDVCSRGTSRISLPSVRADVRRLHWRQRCAEQRRLAREAHPSDLGAARRERSGARSRSTPKLPPSASRRCRLHERIAPTDLLAQEGLERPRLPLDLVRRMLAVVRLHRVLVRHRARVQHLPQGHNAHIAHIDCCRRVRHRRRFLFFLCESSTQRHVDARVV